MKEIRGNSKGFSKVSTILLVALITVALLGILIYRNNKTFKIKVNDFLSKIPGSIGRKFEENAVDGDSKEKLLELSNYYLGLNTDNAADKIFALKLQNESLFDSIIKSMNSVSSGKTEEILKRVRELELRKDSIGSLYNELEEESLNKINEQVSRFEGMETFIVINEIEQRLKIDKEFANELPYIMNNLDEKKASEILYYSKADIREKILLQLDENKRSKLDALILKKESEENKYADIAYLYDTKSIEDSIEEIGNTENYTIEELAKIYSNLNIVKSAEILSAVNDEEFIEELFNHIRMEEELKRPEEPLTLQLSEAMQFVSEYNKKVKELARVYEKMSPDRVALIVENMMENEDTVTSLEIDSEPVYKISDATIIMDVLSQMKKKTVSKVMNNMSTSKSSILSQKMVEP